MPIKIFQLGFNKCASQSLAAFFNENGIPAAHFVFKPDKYPNAKSLASHMIENHQNDKPLLNELDKFTAFFDLENPHATPPIYIAKDFFKLLDEQNPGSKFILNIRNKNDWLRSRSEHLVSETQAYLQLCVEQYGITADAMLDLWSAEFDSHILAVKQYFIERPRDLLIFDIDHDGPEKIAEFFKDDFAFDPRLYKHLNKSKPRSLCLNLS